MNPLAYLDGERFPAPRIAQCRSLPPNLNDQQLKNNVTTEPREIRERLLHRLEQQEYVLKRLMNSIENKERVCEELLHYDKIFGEIVANPTEALQKATAEEGKELTKILDQVDSKVFNFKKEVNEWIYSTRQDRTCNLHLHPRNIRDFHDQQLCIQHVAYAHLHD